jgi:aminoglycoside 6'-N-acetyltransferase
VESKSVPDADAGVVSEREAVSLLPFGPSSAPLLAEWLARLHVARWHPDPDAWVRWARDPPPAGAHALIDVDGRPVGYLRWQRVGRETLDALGLSEIPAGSVDIDILIGEPDCLGRGVGPRALELLIERLRDDKSVPLIGLSPSIDNVAAQRAYLRAGFRKAREYDAPGFGRCALMLMQLDR